MSEYVCHYLTDAVHSARAVYHADELPQAMAMHNAALPEYREKVLKWVGPTGITFLGMHDSKLTPGPENYGTIWVCQDCLMHHANGECGSCHRDDGHDKEPLNAIEVPFHAAMGMAYEEHAEDCETRIQGSQPDNYECDCETNTFSTSQCEGCGSYLHGERHAMTLFKG